MQPFICTETKSTPLPTVQEDHVQNESDPTKNKSRIKETTFTAFPFISWLIAPNETKTIRVKLCDNKMMTFCFSRRPLTSILLIEFSHINESNINYNHEAQKLGSCFPRVDKVRNASAMRASPK